MSGRSYLLGNLSSAATYFSMKSFRPGILFLPRHLPDCINGWGEPVIDGEGNPINNGLGTCDGTGSKNTFSYEKDGGFIYTLHSDLVAGPVVWESTTGEVVTYGQLDRSSHIRFQRNTAVYWKGKQYAAPENVYAAAVFNSTLVVICSNSGVYAEIYAYEGEAWVKKGSTYGMAGYTTLGGWHFSPDGSHIRGWFERDDGDNTFTYAIGTITLSADEAGNISVSASYSTTAHQGIDFTIATDIQNTTYTTETYMGHRRSPLVMVYCDHYVFPYKAFNSYTYSCTDTYHNMLTNRAPAPLDCSSDLDTAMQQGIDAAYAYYIGNGFTLTDENPIQDLGVVTDTLGGDGFPVTQNEYPIYHRKQKYMKFTSIADPLLSITVFTTADECYYPYVAMPGISSIEHATFTTTSIGDSRLLYAGYGANGQAVDVTQHVTPASEQITVRHSYNVFLTCDWNSYNTISICIGGIPSDGYYNAAAWYQFGKYGYDETVSFTEYEYFGGIPNYEVRVNGVVLLPALDPDTRYPESIVYYNPVTDVLLLSSYKDKATGLYVGYPRLYVEGALVHTFDLHIPSRDDIYVHNDATFLCGTGGDSTVLTDAQSNTYVSHYSASYGAQDVAVDAGGVTWSPIDDPTFASIPNSIKYIGRV